MNLESLYSAFVIVVTLTWLLLVVAPKWTWTRRIVHSVWVPFALVGWAFILQAQGSPPPPGAGIGTAHAVVLLLGAPHMMLTVWTLLMGWDLIAGAWLARDARRRNIHHGWVVLSLMATYIFGIAGLCLYLLVRIALRRELSMDEHAA